MKRKGLLIIGVLVVVIGIGVWSSRGTYTSARMGAAYVAKQTCSCLFVAERTLESCRGDFNAEAVRPLQTSVAESSVTVSAFGGLVASCAQFEKGFGCHPVN